MVSWFSKLVVSMTIRMPRWFVRWVSRRYVAGPNLADAVNIMTRLKKEGACFTIDVLGEEITTFDEALDFYNEYEKVISAIAENKLDANISIKPTAFGIHIDYEQGAALIEKLTTYANQHQMFVRLDMEDHRVTDDTINIVIDLHQKGIKNIGTVLQGRLHRTLGDIETLREKLGSDADYRICKGIYLEPENIAYTGYAEIVHATNKAIDAMFDAGAYVGIATHDKPVILHTMEKLNQLNMGPGKKDTREHAGDIRQGKGPGYEFQMLLGVRGPLRRKLLKEGHRVRVYIPYGEKWYEYSIRRLKENPTIGTHVAKAFLMPWTNRP
jgi:proline dehydrogenase